MHYHHSTVNSKRRTPSQVINQCTDSPHTQFVLSVCRYADPKARNFNAQEWTLLCSDPTTDPLETISLYGTCADTEICVSQQNPDADPSVAHCLNVNDYVKINSVRHGKNTGNIQVPTEKPAAGQQLVADAVVTSSTFNGIEPALSVQLQAWKKLSTVHNVPHYGQLPGRMWNCSDCVNLGPVVAPPGTDVLSASATMAANTVGVLYLTTSFWPW